jgi:hypothetical protein
VPAALLLLGAVAVGVGLLLRGPLAAGAAEEADAVQVAPVIDAGSLNDVAVGTRVLAYGRIATSTEAPHGLVAFVRQQYEGTEQYARNDKRPRWRELARHTPALQLDVDGRMVSIAAGEYALDSPPHERAPEGGPVASTLRSDLRLVDLSTQRVRGFAAGDAVTVDATVAAGAAADSASAAGGARTLQAKRLHGGDVAAYRAARGAGGDALPMIGVIFSALGLAVLALGGVLLRRAARAPPAASGSARQVCPLSSIGTPRRVSIFMGRTNRVCSSACTSWRETAPRTACLPTGDHGGVRPAAPGRHRIGTADVSPRVGAPPSARPRPEASLDGRQALGPRARRQSSMS